METIGLTTALVLAVWWLDDMKEEIKEGHYGRALFSLALSAAFFYAYTAAVYRGA